MATIYDVAKLADVSTGTVSRVINNHPNVRARTRRAVQAAVEELQYQPNPIARTLRTSRTRTLGLVFSDLRSNPAVTSFVSAAEVVAQQHGYMLFIADSRFDAVVEERNIRNLLERRVDGLICNPVLSSKAIHDVVRHAAVPAVIFGWTVANRALSTVALNEVTAIGEAVDHLIGLGHRRIGAVLRSGPRGTGGPLRTRLIHDALIARGIDNAGPLDTVIASADECDERLFHLLNAPDPPTALIVLTSALIPRVLMSLRRQGYRVPDDISLVCFGDSEWVQAVTPPLNVVALDQAKHFEAATELVIRIIEEKLDRPCTITHEATYIRRESVSAPRGDMVEEERA